MLNRPTQISQKDFHHPQFVESTLISDIQHGPQRDVLRLILDIPAEVLTGVTSHLDPPSLLSLSVVNKRLYDHVNDDGTWHRAFAQQLLGIGFQNDLHDCHKRLLLRREAKTWKQEFIARFHLLKKWALSRSSTIRHIPVHSAYGIVSRSLPLTGRILTGYINSTGPRIGNGVGNPNVEFAPNISTCVLASDGATAMVLWGKRNGEVTISTANKAVDLSRRGVGFLITRCSIDDEHGGPVLGATWDGNNLAVTGGGDGRIKIWNPQSMRCLWTSDQQRCDLAIDPVVKVASALSTKGLIIGCTRSGNIVIFTGFAGSFTPNVKLGRDHDDVESGSVHTFSIPCPSTSPIDSRIIASLYIDSHASRAEPTLLAAYENDVHFYRITLTPDDAGELQFHIDTFGDHLFGPLSCVRPFFAYRPDQSSFILTGDRMGGIGVYEWRGGNIDSTKGAIRPFQRIEAHADNSTITAIHWDGTTLITGSSRGTTHVFDGLRFQELRSFASPTPKFRGRGHAPPVDPNDDGRVRQILVSPDRDVMVASVGNAVLTWKAGKVNKNVSGGVRGRIPIDGSIHRKKKGHGGKWLQQAELKESIADSRHLLEQQPKNLRLAHDKSQEHQASHDLLGLSEQEALEYAIMLSREEPVHNTYEGPSTAIERDHSSSPEHPVTLGDAVFCWDTDDASSDYIASKSSDSDLIPISASSSSSSANGDVSFSPLLSDSTPSTSAEGDVHFPLISGNATPVKSRGEGSSRPSQISNNLSRFSAWNIPLMKPAGLSSPSSVHSAGSALSSPSQRLVARSTAVEDEFDEDLRLALELSLAEAMSRGEA
ncbi:hypothetical protein Agabi119p4_11316 [Agaricus bisporus var. burnettii]|uniref:F-box domain-containing protein n=1 Tax=Agaricus bisporus var. burnettii TaxID=192524 RepID=A0A8H7BZY6_AGABI|nr:hypothetical protein Agabi119p4_11316 [Agaricus bisporus var. burnettii]